MYSCRYACYTYIYIYFFFFFFSFLRLTPESQNDRKHSAVAAPPSRCFFHAHLSRLFSLSFRVYLTSLCHTSLPRPPHRLLFFYFLLSLSLLLAPFSTPCFLFFFFDIPHARARHSPRGKRNLFSPQMIFFFSLKKSARGTEMEGHSFSLFFLFYPPALLKDVYVCVFVSTRRWISLVFLSLNDVFPPCPLTTRWPSAAAASFNLSLSFSHVWSAIFSLFLILWQPIEKRFFFSVSILEFRIFFGYKCAMIFFSFCKYGWDRGWRNFILF